MQDSHDMLSKYLLEFGFKCGLAASFSKKIYTQKKRFVMNVIFVLIAPCGLNSIWCGMYAKK